MIIYDFRYDEGKRVRSNGLCPGLCARPNSRLSCLPIIEIDGRNRFLTPREKWRLMGFKDEDFDKIENLHPQSTLEIQIGNSIVLDCIKDVLREFIDD